MSNTVTTMTNLGKAEKYLTDKGINFYNTHIPFIQTYRNFLYMRDKDYTHEHIIYNNVVDSKMVKEDRHQKRKVSNIHLLPCKELAKLMFNEKIGFKVVEGYEANNTTITKTITALEKHYTDKKVWRTLENSMIEVYGAGSIGIVNSYDSIYGVQHIVYSSDNILPLKIINNEIEECVFIGTDTVTGNTILRIHKRILENEIETTENLNIPNKKRTVKRGYAIETVVIDKDNNVVESVELKSEVKQFIIIKPFNIEPTDYSAAFGKPIYSDYLDTIKSIDDILNLQDTDMKLSKRQLIMNESLMKDTDGNIHVSDDFTNALIMSVGDSEPNSAEVKTVLYEYAPVPNTPLYDDALNNKIKSFSRDVGLGSDSLSINKMNAPTATQIISENTEKFTTLKKHYEVMRDSFITLNQGILYLLKTHESVELDYSIKIEYNTKDSIIEDDATLEQRAISEINAGVRSKYSFLVDIKGLSGADLTDELERLGLDKDGKTAPMNTNSLNDNLKSDVDRDIEE